MKTTLNYKIEKGIDKKALGQKIRSKVARGALYLMIAGGLGYGVKVAMEDKPKSISENHNPISKEDLKNMSDREKIDAVKAQIEVNEGIMNINKEKLGIIVGKGDVLGKQIDQLLASGDTEKAELVLEEMMKGVEEAQAIGVANDNLVRMCNELVNALKFE